jgi:hypothetical protein
MAVGGAECKKDMWFHAIWQLVVLNVRSQYVVPRNMAIGGAECEEDLEVNM